MPDPVENEIWEGGGRRYRMEKVVGNGAFGVVWRATEDGTNVRVAIKKVRARISHAHSATPVGLRRVTHRSCRVPLALMCRSFSTGATTTVSWR